EVGVDIEIQYTGMRPGEKMYEEMFFSSECAVPTEHEKVLCAKAVEFQSHAKQSIDTLLEAAWEAAPSTKLREMLPRVVPGFNDGVPEIADVTAGEARVTPLWVSRTPTPASVPASKLAPLSSIVPDESLDTETALPN